MSDLSIIKDGELMVAHVEGVTEAGAEFVDGYMPAPGTEYQVVDSDRIILPEAALDHLYEVAGLVGLTWEEVVRR